MFPQTLSAEKTFAVLQSGGKLESGVVQVRDQGWLKHGGRKTRRLSSSMPCLVRAEQHLTGSSHAVRWDDEWKKAKRKGEAAEILFCFLLSTSQ